MLAFSSIRNLLQQAQSTHKIPSIGEPVLFLKEIYF